ncbi:hypothetical protein Neosp_015161 [[Neocosmospora] mangrovei]
MADTAGSSSKGSSRSRFSNRAQWDRPGPRRQARPEPDDHDSQAHPRPQPSMAGLKDEINRGKASYDTKSPHSEQPEPKPSKTNKPEIWEPILSQTQLADLWMALSGPPRPVVKILIGVIWNILSCLWNILRCFGWISANPVIITLLTMLVTGLVVVGFFSRGFYAVTGQSGFAKMIKRYEQCHRNFRNDDLQFMYQVFDHNETLADYEDRRDTGSEVTWSWVSWISFSSAKAGAKRWHPREILEISSSMTESIPSQQQKLNATIIYLGSALEDMEDINTLLGDPVHDLDAIKNIAPGGIASRVSELRSNLVMTIKTIAAARNGLQEESGMIKDKIQEPDGHFTLLKNKSGNLERVMKAGEVIDSSRRELKNDMERMCQQVLERRKKD